jgi:hypothetical protein
MALAVMHGAGAEIQYVLSVCSIDRVLSSVPVSYSRSARRNPCLLVQVKKDGRAEVVSGVGAKGISSMTLSGRNSLYSDGAQRLADLLQKAPPLLLVELDLRRLHPPTLLRPHPVPQTFTQKQVS